MPEHYCSKHEKLTEWRTLCQCCLDEERAEVERLTKLNDIYAATHLSTGLGAPTNRELEAENERLRAANKAGNYTIELVPDLKQGGWCAINPELPGCVSQGETVTDAIRNLADAREAWIETCRDQGLPIPEPREMDPSQELHELSREVERLRAELATMKKHFRQPTHGSCCTCQRCGQDYDTCRCDLDEVAAELASAQKRIEELEGKP